MPSRETIARVSLNPYRSAQFDAMASSASYVSVSPSRDSRGRDSRPSQPRESKRRSARDPNVAMQQYRLEVGREHSVTPGDIVGAIANEADIDSSYIGGINIQDDYSTVELPEGMPKEILNHLKKVRVRNHPMNISIAGQAAPAHDSGKPKRKSKPKKD